MQHENNTKCRCSVRSLKFNKHDSYKGENISIEKLMNIIDRKLKDITINYEYLANIY